MSKRPYMNTRLIQMSSPRESEIPLSLNNKKLCVKCWEFEATPGRITCAQQCQASRKKVIPWSIRVEVWKRDRGVCAICGLDTVALAENSRMEYLKGGQGMQARRVAILSCKGYGKDDDKKIMWAVRMKVMDKKGHGSDHPSNLMTVCQPCGRKMAGHGAMRAAPAQTREFKPQNLFGDFQEEHLETPGSGYSST